MSNTALEIITAARVLTQSMLTIQQLGELLARADTMTEAELDAILAKNHSKIEDNLNN